MGERATIGRERLRHRLIGVAVLVAAALLVAPLVLERPAAPEQASGLLGRIPERPAEVRVEVIPLSPPMAARAADAPPEQPSRQSTGEGPGDVPDPHAGLRPAPGEPPAWVVRLGSFSHRDNALALRERTRAAGFPGFVDEVIVDGRTMFRVNAGPELDRAQGETLRERLRREAGLDGFVAPHD